MSIEVDLECEVVGGVATVTGDGVDNTDPKNPVMGFPNPTDIGLGNVDNTSDTNKPVSTATQTALDGKADKSTLSQDGGNITGSINTGTNTFSLTSSGGGGDIIEDGTKLRYGSGSDFGSGEKSFAGGINTTSVGNNVYTSGVNVSADFNSAVVGTDLGTSSFGAGAVVMGTDVTDYQNNSIILAGSSFQSSNGYKTNSLGSVMIGNLINVNPTLPENSTVNKGVFIGYDLKCVGNVGARTTMIGNSIDIGETEQAILISRETAITGNMQNTVAIGNSLNLDATGGEINNVVIGYQAESYKHPNYGTGLSEGHKVVIGFKALGGGWRNVVVGSHAYSDQVSTTVIGYGAMVTGDQDGGRSNGHSTVVGRGGYSDKVNGYGGGYILYNPNGQFHIGAAFAAHLNPSMPGGETHDDIAALNNGTSVVKVCATSGVDARPTGAVNDTRGGHLSSCGGRSTGTAKGGEFRIETSPAGLVSNNTANPLEIAASFDSEDSVDTRFLLLDVTDSTLKRVEFGADDSAGAGFKTLKVAN